MVDFETGVDYFSCHCSADQWLVSHGSNGPCHVKDLTHGDELNHMMPETDLNCQNLSQSNVDCQSAFGQ
jgi:hypothetical protein